MITSNVALPFPVVARLTTLVAFGTWFAVVWNVAQAPAAPVSYAAFNTTAPAQQYQHYPPPPQWNGSACWNAMQTLAKRVCSLAEVKCVTYGDLVKFSEENASKIADYQAGNFPKMARPPSEGDGTVEATQPIGPVRVAAA